MQSKNMFLILTIGMIMFISACAPTAKIPVVMPAEINLSHTNKIAIGDINGNIGRTIENILTSRLYESGRFEVLDRKNLDKIMKEQKLSLSGAVDESSATEIGKIIGAAAMIFGDVNLKYDEKHSSKVGKCYKDKIEYNCTTYTTEGIATSEAALRVVDLATGKIIATKTITVKERDSAWEKESRPQFDGEPLKEKAVEGVIDRFMKMIAPYTIMVNESLEKANTPEGESGVQLAQKGMWNEAIELFLKSIDACPKDKPKKIACEYYNLAIAYKYTEQFDLAIAAIKKAIELNPQSKYHEQMASIRTYQQTRKRLAEQAMSTQ